MPSQIQLEANCANAQLSTGPRTDVGKARASLNYRKHGLSAANLVIAEADREAFDSMQAAFLEDLSPQGELELNLRFSTPCSTPTGTSAAAASSSGAARGP